MQATMNSATGREVPLILLWEVEEELDDLGPLLTDTFLGYNTINPPRTPKEESSVAFVETDAPQDITNSGFYPSTYGPSNHQQNFLSPQDVQNKWFDDLTDSMDFTSEPFNTAPHAGQSTSGLSSTYFSQLNIHETRSV
jgi:hypothetical protein